MICNLDKLKPKSPSWAIGSKFRLRQQSDASSHSFDSSSDSKFLFTLKIFDFIILTEKCQRKKEHGLW